MKMTPSEGFALSVIAMPFGFPLRRKPPEPAPTEEPAPDPSRRPASPLLRDAFITIVIRFGLAFLIFATDIALARLLGPSCARYAGRFRRNARAMAVHANTPAKTVEGSPI